MIVADAPPTVGAESRLTCQVWGVHPAQLLSLTWLQGGAVVQGTPASGSDPVQSQYHFLPAGADSGATISCRATLELQQLPADTRTREASMVLQPLCEFSTPVPVPGPGFRTKTKSQSKVRTWVLDWDQG